MMKRADAIVKGRKFFFPNGCFEQKTIFVLNGDCMEDEMLNEIISEEQLQLLLKRKQEFIDGTTPARDWAEIEKELDKRYNS
ncbi:hypothetical protein IDJ77_01550 [Mucilaginibacter sp. ZT4R22]|uniref:Addiction module component n=1 Tax=Mucilaginibacter pankratovii TaxID=2772110 RepID=A0ABR7WLY3_9SPHI|nr:hypothetical protein [Mucilaginibacter pankratovii]MBD1362482.1 hypothetical protein [Mucilaginibacter pankratovii]